MFRILKEIIDSGRFDLEEYRQRSLTMAEAFVLLWQDPATGDVHGRSADNTLHSTAVACVLIDLYAIGKIEFNPFKEKKAGILCRLLGPQSQEVQDYLITAIDRAPTYTFLDDCLFNLILDSKHDLTVQEWMKSSLTYPSHVLTAILRKLVDRGILEVKDSKEDFTKFPTLNPAPQRQLVNEIKMIALHGHVADGFMWPLLKLARGYDHISSIFYRTLITKHFDKEQVQEGLHNVDKICFPDRLLPVKKKKYRKQKQKNSGSFDNLFT